MTANEVNVIIMCRDRDEMKTSNKKFPHKKLRILWNALSRLLGDCHNTELKLENLMKVKCRSCCQTSNACISHSAKLRQDKTLLCKYQCIQSSQVFGRHKHFFRGVGGGGESELSHAQSFALSKTHTIFIRL